MSLASSLFISMSCQASNLTIIPTLRQNFEYDTNPLLSQNAKTLFGFITEPELYLADTTPTDTLYFDNRLDISRFNLANYSSSDVHSNFGARRTTDSGFLQFNGNFDFDTTRTSEILNSGLNIAGIRHTGLNLSPEIGLQLFKLDLVTLQGGYQSSSYDDNSNRFIDYQVFQLIPTLTHTIDANNSAIGTIQASYFETTSGSPGQTTAVGPGIGWQHNFSAPLSIYGTGGYYFISYKQFGIQNSREDYFFNVNLSYTGLSDTLSLILARQLSPEATTLQITTTSLAFQERHKFAPDTTGIVNITYQDDSVSIFVPGQQQNFIQALASLKYRVTETFAVSLGYRFRQQKTIGDTSKDTSNALLFNVIFSPDKIFLNG